MHDEHVEQTIGEFLLAKERLNEVVTAMESIVAGPASKTSWIKKIAEELEEAPLLLGMFALIFSLVFAVTTSFSFFEVLLPALLGSITFLVFTYIVIRRGENRPDGDDAAEQIAEEKRFKRALKAAKKLLRKMELNGTMLSFVRKRGNQPLRRLMAVYEDSRGEHEIAKQDLRELARDLSIINEYRAVYEELGIEVPTVNMGRILGEIDPKWAEQQIQNPKPDAGKLEFAQAGEGGELEFAIEQDGETTLVPVTETASETIEG